MGHGDEEQLDGLLERLDDARGREREAIRRTAVGLAQGLREDAERRTDLRSYCLYSVIVGSLLLRSPRPSDAFAPLAASYLTACAAGAPLDAERAEAADLLVEAYTVAGDSGRAAECLVEATDVARRAGTTGGYQVTDLPALLAAVGGGDRDAGICSLYRTMVRPALDQPGWPLAARALIDERLGFTEVGFHRLEHELRPLTEAKGGDLAVSAHHLLAEAALRDQGLVEARAHVDEALRLVEVGDAPWLRAPLLGLSAAVHVAAGDDDHGLGEAVRAWAEALPVQLRCQSDLARRIAARLAEQATDVAFAIACRRRAWRLLTELIENSRLQRAAGSGEDPSCVAVADLPAWVGDRAQEAIANGAVQAGLQAALMGSSRSRPGPQVVAACRGEAVLADAVPDREGEGPLHRVDVFHGLDHVFRRGGVAWWAAVRGRLLYWTLTDDHGPFDGGVVDLDEPLVDEALRSLAAARDGDDGSAPPFDAVGALADAGSAAGEKLLASLTEVIPEYIRLVAQSRVGGDPLPVVMALPPALAGVPLAVLPLAPGGPRLVEGVELTFATTAAVRATAPPPPPAPSPAPVLLSCSNPRGDLHPWPPVRGGVTLEGSEAAPVPEDVLVDALAALETTDGVLFVRSHPGAELTFATETEHGLVVADGVVSARTLAHRGREGLRLPRRVVLVPCSGAGGSDVSGLALGLAAACRSLGAEEVVTSTFAVLDSAWSGTFGERLVAAASRGEPLSVAVRRLQLEALGEWRAALVITEDRDPAEGPVPLVWAGYGVVT